MKRDLRGFAIFVGLLALAGSVPGATPRDLVIVGGAEGEPTYKPIFEKEAAAWSRAGSEAGMNVRTISGSASSLAELKNTLSTLPKDGGDLWVVLIGHGTFDGKNAKFNLPGDDLSAPDYAESLKPFHRRLVLLNLFSASGTFLPLLSGKNRVVLTATRSGMERNYSRFGEKLAESLDKPEADLDADGQTSLTELSAFAAAEVVKFYESQQRVVTEHSLLDDNGDRLGTETPLLIDPKTAAGKFATPDGLVATEIALRQSATAPVLSAAQRERRTDLEKRIADLRTHKGELGDDDYYRRLEGLMLQMAALYEEARGDKTPPIGRPR